MILTSKKKLETLSYGSRKRVLIRCDYCEQTFSREYRKHVVVRDNNPTSKDFCQQCIQIKNADTFLGTINCDDKDLLVNAMVNNNSVIISGVYAIRDIKLNASYIGSSKNIIQRWKSHFQKSEKAGHYIQHFRDVDINDVEFIVLEQGVPAEELIKLEYKYIRLFQVTDRAYGFNSQGRTVKSDSDSAYTGARNKLSESDVVNIKKELIARTSLQEIADNYSVNYNTIYDILKCETWVDVGCDLNSALKAIELKTGFVGSNNPDARLDEAEVKEIKQILEQDERTMISIAKEFGVSGTLISHIKNNKLWTHVSAN